MFFECSKIYFEVAKFTPKIVKVIENAQKFLTDKVLL